MSTALQRQRESAWKEWWTRRRRTFLVVAPILGLAVLPFLLEGMVLKGAAHNGNFAFDFNHYNLPAARNLAAGHSPYPFYGYPPLVVFALVPFTFLPAPDVLFTILVVLCVPGALWLLGVRDWRCYGAAFLWAPVYVGVQTANVTLPLLFAVACCWRYRDRPALGALSAGLAIAAKIICWPLAVWLAATRRFGKTAMGAALVAALVTFGLWALIGFSGLRGFLANLNGHRVAETQRGYTVQAVAADVGLPAVAGTALWAGVVIVLIALCVIYGRRGDDRRSFSFAIVACILASPIVWIHSYALLLAPVALYRPRFSAVWLLPALLWVVSGTPGDGTPWQRALVLGVAAAVFVTSVFREPPLAYPRGPQNGSRPSLVPVSLEHAEPAASLH